jgi:hypothetical protein
MMLGLFVATAATEVVGRKTVGAGLLLPLAVAGVPLMDVLLAVWRRAVRKRLAGWRGGEGGYGIFSPDKDHLHHRLLARGWSQARVTRILHGVAVVLSLLALAPLLLGGRGVVLTVVGCFVIALFGLRHLASVEFVQSGNLVRLAVKRRQGSRGWRACYFFWDLLVLPLAALAGVLLDTNFGRREAYSAAPWEFVVLFTVAGLVMLRLLKVYRRLWSRARLREFLLVAAGLGVAGLATAALVQVVAGDLTWRISRITLTATVLAVVGILFPRCLPELLRELAVDSGHRQRQELAGGRRRLLVYGAGDLGSLYLDHLAGIPPAHFERVQVIGFIDDKRLLKGRLLRGFEIFGTLEDLPGLSRELRLDGVVLAIRELDEVKRARLQAILTEAGLESLEWDLILRGDEVRPGPADGIEVA